MARENFKREQEVLRTLFLDGGAMTRRQFAARLGLSMESLDKVIAELKQAWDASCGDNLLLCENGAYVLPRFRRKQNDLTRKVLFVLYRLKAVRQTEVDRIAFVLAKMQQKSQTIPSIIEAMAYELGIELDRKTAESYLDYLVEIGAVRCSKRQRPFQYSLNLELFESLNDDELDELHAFVDFCANTDVFSAAGYLLLDSLESYMKTVRNRQPASPFAYKYNYYGRILDEYLCHKLLGCIAKRQKIRIVYEGKRYRRYRAQHCEREAEGALVVPVRVVYDHQYGRWYLIAFDDDARDKPYDVYRFERIEEIEPTAEEVEAETFRRMEKMAEQGLEQAWIAAFAADNSNKTEVVVRFWFDPATDVTPVNFVRARVEREGRWGTIEEESEASFLYRIRVTDMSEMKSWLLSFGSAAEVVAPELFRRIMMAEWQSMRERYAVI